MKLTILKSSLLPALRRARDVADHKSTMPILAHVCLRATATRLSVLATDLNVSAVASLPVKGAKPGAICLPAKALHDLVAGLPDGDVSLSVDGTWAEVKAGKVKYRVVGLPDKDYPKIASADDAAMVATEAAPLRELFARTLFATCRDDTRHHLGGVLLELRGDKARGVATDGHRLALADRAVTCPALPGGIIVPREGVGALLKLLGDAGGPLSMAVHANHMFLAADDVTVGVKLTDATFPPYEQVIPKAHKTRVTVDRASLHDAVKRCAMMASDVRGLKLTVTDSGGIILAADDPSVGEVREEIEAAEVDGDALTIGLNPAYLLDALAAITAEQVTLDCGGALDPIVLRPLAGDDLFVVMPMRV